MVKNLIVFALLVAAYTALPVGHVRVIGNILTRGMNRVRYLGSEIVHARPAIAGNRVIFQYPQNPSEDDHIIRGIKTVHNSLESKMQIIDGGIGKKQVTIAVDLPEKADTEFYFYGDVKPEAETETKTGLIETIKNFFGANKKTEQVKTASASESIKKENEIKEEGEAATKSSEFQELRDEYEQNRQNHNEQFQGTKSSGFKELREEYEQNKQNHNKQFHENSN